MLRELRNFLLLAIAVNGAQPWSVLAAGGTYAVAAGIVAETPERARMRARVTAIRTRLASADNRVSVHLPRLFLGCSPDVRIEEVSAAMVTYADTDWTGDGLIEESTAGRELAAEYEKKLYAELETSHEKKVLMRSNGGSDGGELLP